LPHVTRGSFILFMAVAMSITAVPVLASIIKERGLGSTGPAGVAMSSAGLLDVVGWLLLAVAIAASGAGPPAGKAAAWLVIYLLCMLLLVRPALRRWMLAPALPGLGREAIVVPLVFASAWCTEQMGLHPIFGALLVGVIMPRRWDGTADADVVETVEKASSVLLPVFFVVTGLSVRIGALTSHGWELLAVVCVLAVAGKVGGSALGARLTRMSTRDSAITGVLMNTRGLTELIAINAGRQAGLINETMYTILVLMALVTTALTGPMLALLRAAPDGTGAGAGAVAERPLSPAR
jgi:Kef-type K+ transport system membrane component KefB